MFFICGTLVEINLGLAAPTIILVSKFAFVVIDSLHTHRITAIPSNKTKNFVRYILLRYITVRWRHICIFLHERRRCMDLTLTGPPNRVVLAANRNDYPTTFFHTTKVW